MSISVLDFAFGLTDIADLIDPALAEHHRRVASLAAVLGRRFGLSGESLEQMAIAGAIHDLGALTLAERLRVLQFDIELYEHAEPGYLLLRACPPFAEAAEIVRYHHTSCEDGEGLDEHLCKQAQLLQLADRLAVSAFLHALDDHRAFRIREHVATLRGSALDATYLDAVLELPNGDPLWTEILSPRPSAIEDPAMRAKRMSASDICDMAQIIGHLIDFRSRFTATHSFAVAAVTEYLAPRCGVPDGATRELKAAAYLHDVGKLALPAELVDKETTLGPVEQAMMRGHSMNSQRALYDIPGMERIAMWVGNHHERMDGSGYPWSLRADELDLESRILAVADVFTALAEDRPYRVAMSPAGVRAKLHEMARQELDAEIVGKLLDDYATAERTRASAHDRALKLFRDFEHGSLVIQEIA